MSFQGRVGKEEVSIYMFASISISPHLDSRVSLSKYIAFIFMVLSQTGLSEISRWLPMQFLKSCLRSLLLAGGILKRAL